jgi:hypothetical protein
VEKERDDAPGGRIGPWPPDLFDLELAAAKRLLEEQPQVPPVYATVRSRVMRRVLLPKTERHVYYSIDEASRSVVVHVIGGARKGRDPTL